MKTNQDESIPSGCTPDCLMADEIRTILRDQTQKLERIETAIVGDPRLGLEGLVKTREQHTQRIESLEKDRGRIITYAVASLTVLGACWEIAKTVIFKK